MSQQPPVASDESRITIRHRRPPKWPVSSLVTTLGTFWIGVLCLSTLKLPATLFVLMVIGSLLAFGGQIAAAAIIFIRNPISVLQLGDDLDIGGFSFAPSEIERIIITPDPQEDYCEEQGPLRRIEVHFRRIAQHRAVEVIATDSDADQVASWARKFEIESLDCRSPEPPVEEVAA